LERYFTRVGLSYGGWAFLEGTGNYDIDSRLVNPLEGALKSKGDVGFFYPGVNASVVLSEAVPLVKQSNVISFLKLRGAISKSGNVNLGPYGFEGLFGLSTFFPYGNILGFETSTVTPAADFRPEFVKTKEVGFEIGFLKNRVNVEATYYNQNNTDQILGIQLSNTTGFNTAIQNAASFVNKGLEFDLKLTPLVRLGKVNIDLAVNYANQTNKVYSIVDGINELGIGNSNFVIVGQSAYTFKLTDYQRDDQKRIIVDRQTGMPALNSNLTQFGNTIPENILGLNLSIDWKGLSLSAVGEHRSGSQMLAQDLGGFLDDNGISARSAANGRRAFIFPNSVYEESPGSGKYVENRDVYTTNYGRLFWNNDLNTGVQTNYLASAAFWKLREISLTYAIPTKIFGSKVGNVFKGATIGINGRNLFMWLPKSNQWTDPEFSTTTGNAAGVSSASQLPPTRIFGANLALRF
jgi:hypothetical protein